MFDRKLHYKLEIMYNKYSPFIISALLIVYHIMQFVFPADLTWLEYICLPSVLTSLHMYNSREVFMLCKVHRCFVTYVVGNILIAICEHYWALATNPIWFAFVMAFTAIMMLLGLYYYNEANNIDISSPNLNTDCNGGYNCQRS